MVPSPPVPSTCSGSAAPAPLEDRAKATTKAVAELLHNAGVKFAVLGPAETCTGDPARRLGNEFVYTMLAQQNVETLNDAGVAKGSGKKITYHDPCFLGRHNKVYTPPRSLIDAVPGTTAQEMHRCKGKGFCCGAGGARMWLEERTGKRINEERIDEALALDPDTISTACPYCMVMLGDAVNAKKAAGQAMQNVEVIDVA
jgi:Fe-S oxidoreductase